MTHQFQEVVFMFIDGSIVQLLWCVEALSFFVVFTSQRDCITLVNFFLCTFGFIVLFLLTKPFNGFKETLDDQNIFMFRYP